MKIVAGAMGLLMYAGIATAQSVFPSARDFNPCPGGKASLRLNIGENPGLDRLVRLSNLIIRGRVANMLPPVSFNLNQTVTNIETDSLILVEQVFHGDLPPDPRTIALMQIGGDDPKCSVVVQDDPLVKDGEQYIFFLKKDPRTTPPNTSGSPRYYAVGYWSGKAKIVDEKIQFLPATNAELRGYNNTDIGAFIETLQSRIDVVRSKPIPKQPRR